MLEFFEMIGNYLSTFVNFITSFIDSLISGIVYVIASLGYLSTAVQFLPPVLLVAGLAVIAVAIIHIFLLMS